MIHLSLRLGASLRLWLWFPFGRRSLQMFPRSATLESFFFNGTAVLQLHVFCASPGESCDLLQHHVYFRSKRNRFEGRFPLISLTKALLKIPWFPSRKVGHTGIHRYRMVYPMKRNHVLLVFPFSSCFAVKKRTRWKADALCAPLHILRLGLWLSGYQLAMKNAIWAFWVVKIWPWKKRSVE